MATLWIDGFDFYDQLTLYPSSPGPGGAFIDLTGTRSRPGSGIGCLILTEAFGPNYNIPPTGGSSNNFGLVGQTAFFQPGTENSNSFISFNRFDNPIEQSMVEIGVSPSLAITVRVRDGNVLAGTSQPNVIIPNTYNVVEFKVFFSATGSVQVKVNGATVLTLTGIDTIISGSGDGGCETVALNGPGGAAGGRHDDFVLMDTSGPVNNNYIGPVNVFGFPPNADSAPLQWTPSTPGAHFPLVDSVPPQGAYPPGVTSLTVGQQDQYLYPVTGITPNSVVFSIGHELLLQSVGGANSIGSSVNGIVSIGQPVASAFFYYKYIYDLDPVTGQPWNLSDFPNGRALGPAVTA